MADLMKFPNTVEEFMEKYKITDTEQIYTNGVGLIPIFRMKQWLEHKPEQRWIPVSERLPEDERYVLVTTVSGDVNVAKYWRDEMLWAHGLFIIDVTAWQPLPKPWKGEEHDSERNRYPHKNQPKACENY